MRKVSIGRVLAIVALAALVAGPAFAQDNKSVVAGGWAPTFVSGGGSTTTLPKAAFLNLGIPVTGPFQAVADVTYIHIAGMPAYDGIDGLLMVRYLLPAGGKSMSPFVEGGGGIGYVSLGDRTQYLFSLGGGIDMKTSAPVAFRFQVNYVLAHAVNGSGNDNQIRIGIGISNKK